MIFEPKCAPAGIVPVHPWKPGKAHEYLHINPDARYRVFDLAAPSLFGGRGAKHSPPSIWIGFGLYLNSEWISIGFRLELMVDIAENDDKTTFLTSWKSIPNRLKNDR